MFNPDPFVYSWASAFMLSTCLFTFVPCLFTFQIFYFRLACLRDILGTFYNFVAAHESENNVVVLPWDIDTVLTYQTYAQINSRQNNVATTYNRQPKLNLNFPALPRAV